MEDRRNCPHCNDNRARYYERNTGKGVVYHCFNCGVSGFKPHEDLSPTELLKYIKSLSVIPSKSSSQLQVKLPFDFTTKIPQKGLQWFYKYGILDEDIKCFQFGYSPKYNRVILPVFDKEQLIYYQARTLDVPSKANPKYINVRQCGAKSVWFKNFSHTKKDTLVVVEDILSAIKVGKVTNTLSLLGSYIPVSFVDVAKYFNKIYLWLDRDKLKEALGYATKFRILTGKQIIVVCEILDPKEYTIQKIEEVLNK